MESSQGTILLTAFLLFLILSKFISYRKLQAKSKSQGCSPAPVIPRNDILGLTRFRSFLKARSEKQALPWMVETMDLTGKGVHTAKDTMLGHTFIWTRDVENARAILTQASDFEIVVARQKSLLAVVGSGIFTSTGETWKESRAFLRPQFARGQVSSLDLEEKHFQTLLNAIGENESNWTSSFDITPLLFNFTLDVATEFLFGASADSQTTPTGVLSDHDRFQYHFDGSAQYFGVRAALGSFYWMYSPRKFREHCRAIHAYVDGYVQNAVMRKQKHGRQAATDSKKFVLLDELLEVITDRVRLRNECLNVLGAGRTTTATLLQWCFYFLSRHPSTYAKLRNVILADFGTFENTDRITFDTLKRCQFLHCCINETLRVSPVIPIHLRAASRDTTLPRGGGANGQDPIFLPKGTEIRAAFYPMCMRTDLWGEDAAMYRPERFEDRTLLSAWIPFGAGPRLCIGQSLSITEASYVIVRFLQRFDRLESTDPPGPISYDWNISNRCAGGVNIRFHRASV